MCQKIFSISLFLLSACNIFRITLSTASVAKYPNPGGHNTSNISDKYNSVLNFVLTTSKENLNLPENTSISLHYDKSDEGKNYELNTISNVSTLHSDNSSSHFTSVTSVFQYNVTVSTPFEPLLAHNHTNETEETEETEVEKHSEFENDPRNLKIASQHSSTARQYASAYGTKRLAFLDEMLKNYDKRAWPTYGTDDATNILINLHINTLGPVNAANMEYDMDIYLRMSWKDLRLKLTPYGMKKVVTLNGEDIVERIWKPDIFFRNVKEAKFHEVTVPNRLVKLYPDGDILYSLRLTLKLACQMSFRHYPLDTQRCYVILGPYAQTMDQVTVQWMPHDAITLEKTLELPEFDIANMSHSFFIRKIDTGAFSFLNVTFVLVRQNGFHIIQTYMPTFLLVMISWVSFWLNVDSTPARVTLGVTTLLTLTTVAYGVRMQLPPVSYVKAIDIWIGVCSVFVFGALLEFTLVNYLSRSKLRPEEIKKSVNIFHWTKKVHMNDEEKIDPDSQIAINLKRARIVDRFCRVFFPASFSIFNVIYWLYYLYVPDEYA